MTLIYIYKMYRLFRKNIYEQNDHTIIFFNPFTSLTVKLSGRLNYKCTLVFGLELCFVKSLMTKMELIYPLHATSDRRHCQTFFFPSQVFL